jgi:hypothetical protein
MRHRPVLPAPIHETDCEPVNSLPEAAALLAPRAAVIVTVWKEGIGLHAIEPPEHLPPAQLDVRMAGEVDQAMATRAQRMAEHGAALAREAGLDAVGLAVAEEVDVPVLVRGPAR